MAGLFGGGTAKDGRVFGGGTSRVSVADGAVSEYRGGFNGLTFSIILFISYLVFGQLVMTVALSLVSGKLSFIGSVIVTIVSELLVIVFALWGSRALGSFSAIWDKLKLNVFKFKHVLFGFVAGVAFYVLLQYVGPFLSDLFGADEKSSRSSNTTDSVLSQTGFSWFVSAILFASISAPILEEIIFRGLIAGSIYEFFGDRSRVKIGVVVSVLLSAVMFGFIHAQGFSSFNDWFVIAWTGFFGAFNAMLMLYTKSLYPSIFCHIAYNLSTTLIAFYASTH